MDILQDLEFRGLLNQVSHKNALRARLKQGPITLYIGFDPTADSLHLGNLLVLLGLRRFQLAGHYPIAIAGGGTGLIGDPSGKAEERQLNPEKTVKDWNHMIRKQLERFLDFETKKNPAKVVNNYNWLSKLNYIEFLRDTGKYFSLNDMLDRESVKQRLKTGISFTEFNYMIMQAYDFMELNKRYGCELQLGGSDQWGNIISGVELIRKKLSKPAYALTFPLVTKSDGTKFGKTESGTVWLDPKKTPPYAFYQFWVNTDDRDVVKMLKYFTFLGESKIKALEKSIQSKPRLRQAQKMLAAEITSLVHGQRVTRQAIKISESLFSGQTNRLSSAELDMACRGLPTTQVKRKNHKIIDLLVDSGVAPSKRQAREDIAKGAISVNGKKIEDNNLEVGELEPLARKYFLIKRGKRKFCIAILDS